jgi:hypothetical protein
MLMNKKIVGIMICILFFGASILPVISGYEKEINDYENDDYNSLIKQNIKSGVISYDWLEEAKLLASDGAIYNHFGYSVSIYGDYLIIGAPGDDDNGYGSGSAYVFMRSGTSWTEQAKLIASDGVQGDTFGFSVSIDGDTAIIGAVEDDDNGDASGSAYIFTRSGTTWSEQAKLIASDGAEDDYFGKSVSIDDDTVIIGAEFDDDNGFGSGSAYIFMRSGTSWTEQAKLLASDGEEGDGFGWSVSIDGDTVIIGAYGTDDNGDYSGSAYIFMRSGTSWTEQVKLLAPDGEANDLFGISVSIDDDTALIGAHGDDDVVNSGAVYIFLKSGTSWTHQAKLLASDGEEGDAFGWSVSISGDFGIIGAPGVDDNGYLSGSAYIFKRSGISWTEQAKLLASDGEEENQFGFSVSIDGSTAIIGTPADNDNGDLSGSAYIFTREVEEPIPMVCCDPGILYWTDVKTSSIVTGTFHVWNCGDENSLLNWEVDTTSLPSWITGAVFTPDSGTILYGDPGDDVTFTFTAPTDKYSIFDDKIKIVNSDNSSDFCEMDVHLETPRNHGKFLNLFEQIIQRFPLLKTIIGLQ